MKLPFTSLRLGYDIYERHRLVASFINLPAKQSILDVGGHPGMLAQFLSGPVTVINLGAGNIISNGMYLPFADQSFYVVTSLDVLEHIPPANRSAFVAELFRVAKAQVIFCAPFGSQEHIQTEKKILAELKNMGLSNPMLEEHVLYGIPTAQEIQAYLPSNTKNRFVYTGNIRFNSILFRVDHSFGGVKTFRLFKMALAILLNLAGNILVYPLYKSSRPHKYTNRVTAIASKIPDGSP